jgi:hypothetical protein
LTGALSISAEIADMYHLKPNFKRMMDLIDQTFATRNDPGQIQVTQTQMKKLRSIHSATLSEFANDDGPLIWILLVPTTHEVMEDFLQGNISETELLKRIKPNQDYDCIYLCSATTLPEVRGKGETKKLCLNANQNICKDHAIKTLFVWPFTNEGEKLAHVIAQKCNMTLKIKT